MPAATARSSTRSSRSGTDAQAPGFDVAAWRPQGRTWVWMLGGFGLGLLMFLSVLVSERGDDSGTATADTAPATASKPNYMPLPSPLPADDDGASGMGEIRDDTGGSDDGRPRLVEAPPPPPAPVDTTTEPPLPAPVPVDAGPSPDEPRPVAGQTPAPRYPAASLRRGETGTVIVRATIDVDGRPRDLDVARSSGSRRLDRAATDAVRRWRFHPAHSNGQPVEASVNVPIEFKQ